MGKAFAQAMQTTSATGNATKGVCGWKTPRYHALRMDHVEKRVLEQKMSVLEGGFEAKKWQKKASEQGFEVQAPTGA